MTEQTYVKHANIFEAIIAVMNDVGYVKKQRGQNINYTYAGEAALISALRPAMVEHGIFMYVLFVDNLVQDGYTTSKGNEMNRTILRSTIRFQHEGGTYIDVMAAGEGADSGDKSLNKALTGAYKYALRQTFCIETGDDPDKYPSEPRQEPKPANVSRPTPAATAPTSVKNTTPAPANVSQPSNGNGNGTPTSGNGHEAAPVYTGKTCKIGKNVYPYDWGVAFADPKVGIFGRIQPPHVDGILQKLELDPRTRADVVRSILVAYEDAKDRGDDPVAAANERYAAAADGRDELG